MMNLTTPTHYLYKIHFNIIISTRLFPWNFSIKILYLYLIYTTIISDTPISFFI
jgi:hypothetical protein